MRRVRSRTMATSVVGAERVGGVERDVGLARPTEVAQDPALERQHVGAVRRQRFGVLHRGEGVLDAAAGEQRRAERDARVDLAGDRAMTSPSRAIASARRPTRVSSRPSQTRESKSAGLAAASAWNASMARAVWPARASRSASS